MKHKFNRYAISTSVIICLIASIFISCNFWSSITNPTTKSIPINSLSLGKSNLTMKVGSLDYISVSIKPQDAQKDVTLVWSYDRSIIKCDTTSNWGVTITALKEGQTSLRCSYGGYDATCLISVSGFEDGYETTTEPYIYSNTTILQTSPGITEKVFVSLYGGDVSDIDGYTWTIDNPTVATIQPTGQYCLITAKDSGYARIKVTHNKAVYPYYIGIYVFADATKVTYITTQNNIITMNTGDSSQNISVNLVNGKDTSSDSLFKWEVIDKDSSDIPITIDYNSNNAIITPKQSGSCTLRITHPDATYPLDILCRVITIVKNVYILPDNTVVSMHGEELKTVTCSLENIKDGEYSIDEYEYRLDDYNVAEIVSYVGNQVTVKGKANGSCKLSVFHPKSAYTREILLIVTGQLTDAIDASFYITTSQNYIRTKIGAEPTAIAISLKGGDTGDENGFVWNVKSSPTSGTNDVIKLETPNGTANYSRAASQTYAYGTAYITPNTEGSAVISVSHPKIVYPTEILVKVLSPNAVLTEPLYFTGNGLIRIINGEKYDYSVELRGDNKTFADDQNIQWNAENFKISIVANANEAQITAPPQGTGNTISFITISHPKCDTPKKVLVMTADDVQTLYSMKALYSDKLYYNIEVEDTCVLMASEVGFGTNDEETGNYIPYDFRTAKWEVKNPTICSVEKTTENPLNARVKGLKAGTTSVSVSIDNVTCEFTITVYPKGTVAIEPEIYFTTSQNVVSLNSIKSSTTVYVSAINLSSREYSNIQWSLDNEDIVSIVPNGTNVTITAKASGEAILSVTHPKSQNTLKIYIRVGSEYVIPEAEPIVYIGAPDVITLLKNSQSQQLQATLVNYTGSDKSGFKFAIDNETVAKITAQTPTGIAYITPISSGQAEITITHTATQITKKVLVLVGNSEEELAGITYLTTSQNVVAIGEGQTRNITVSVKNSPEVILDGYTWTSSNPAIVDISTTGSTAVLKGNSIGTAMITVSNKACKYPLTIIAQVVNPIAASASPYIQLSSSVLTLTVSSNFTNITADLVGGTESDYSDFTWSTNDSSVCVVYGQNEVGKIRALKEGTTYVTVSHPKSNYSAQILVVCDKKTESECYISVPSSIITMKPTDSSQTISATLINGSSTDKYNFSWSLDVYDVIDVQYSANVCTITPKQSGSCTITVRHPKSSYDQQIIVNVQEYTTFSFPFTNTTVTQGNVTFITMQVPTTKVTTHVEYSVDNSRICSISGTKAVAQIQAIENGTTTVRAKLVASSTGVVQAQSEMMIYVKEKATDSVYITAPNTIYTVNKGKSQTLSASLNGTGVTVSDNANLTWSTSDSDVVQVTGINTDGTVKGNQIYITALKSGEALITCSHEKAASTLQFYVVVPGTAGKAITLNKSYISLQKGSSGTTIKANIENAENSSDYYDIIWTCEDVSGKGKDIARVMGSGQTVTIYPVSPGEAKLTAQLPDVEKVATCTVIVQETKTFTFERTSQKVQPFHSTKVKYTVSPADAILTWTTTQDDNYFEYTDLGTNEEGVGYLQINGIKEGSGAIYCVTDGGAKGTLTVKVSWDYSFKLDTQKISGTPTKEYNIYYKVNPTDSIISIPESEYFNTTIVKNSEDSGEGTIILTPLKTCNTSINISALNPNADNATVGRYDIPIVLNYPKLTITPEIINKVSLNNINENAYYSNIVNNTIYVGDGEKVTIKLNVEEKNVDPTLNITGTLQNIKYTFSGNELILEGIKEYTESCYIITEGYAPTYQGKKTYPDGTPILPKDFEKTTQFLSNSEHDGLGWDVTKAQNKFRIINKKLANTAMFWDSPNSKICWGPWNGNSDPAKGNDVTHTFKVTDLKYQNEWGVTRAPELDGTIMSATEFQNCIWYYLPLITEKQNYSCNGGNAKKIGHGSLTLQSVPDINTQNIKAKFVENSYDTSLIKETRDGTIVIDYSYEGGNANRISLQVISQTRKCLCTYKEK